MTTAEDIQSQEKRLHLYRRTLSNSLEQMAMLGSAHAPPGLVHTISEARDNILHIKSVLRGWGVEVENHPDDDGPTMSNHHPTQSKYEPTNHEPVETQEENSHPHDRDSSSQNNNKEESSDFEDSNERKKIEHRGDILVIARAKVRITFHMPYAFEDAKCEIEFSSPGLHRVEISLNHTDILGYLMSGLDTSPDSGARRFINKTDEDLFEARLGQIQITLQQDEAFDLCACIDIVCDEYKKRIMEAEDLLETGSFLLVREESVPGIGFELFAVQLELWKLMCKFTSEFDYDKGDSEWHIFDGRGDCIRISRFEESRFPDHALIYGQRIGRHSIDNYVYLIFAVPRWLLRTVDTIWDGWQNNIGPYGIWTATYTKNWLLKRFIPTVCQHYLGTSESYHDLVYEWKKAVDVNTQTSISQSQEEISIQRVNQPNQLTTFMHDVHSWFYGLGLNIKTSTVVDFFESFLEFAQDAEPSTVNTGYIWEKLGVLNIDILDLSGIDELESIKGDYSDILICISNYTDYLKRIDFVSSEDIELILRVFSAIVESKFTRIHQSRLNTLKKHLLPLWEESEFERRYVMTQWNWNGLWFER